MAPPFQGTLLHGTPQIQHPTKLRATPPNDGIPHGQTNTSDNITFQQLCLQEVVIDFAPSSGLGALPVFLAELLFCYLTGNIFGIEISCRRHADDTRTRLRVRFHWRMTYVVRMSSAQQLCIKDYWLPCYIGLYNYFTTFDN